MFASFQLWMKEGNEKTNWKLILEYFKGVFSKSIWHILTFAKSKFVTGYQTPKMETTKLENKYFKIKREWENLISTQSVL